MKITKRQLRRIIREAIDPREMEEPLGGWAGNALHNDPRYKHHTDTDHFKEGDLVRKVDYRGDGRGGDYKKTVGDQIGTVIEIDEDIDGTQYTVLFADGSTIMDVADSFEAVSDQSEDSFTMIMRVATEILGYPPTLDEEQDGSITVITNEQMSDSNPAFGEFLSRFPDGEWVDFDEFSTGIY